MNQDHHNVIGDVGRALGRTVAVKPEPLAPFVEPADESDRATLIARFIQEATAVRARVYQLAEARLNEQVAEICAGLSGQVAVSGAALFSRQNIGQGFKAFNGDESDHDQLVQKLADCAAGITAADYAIAETGTIVLSSDEPNALLVSLLPPIHIAVLRSSQVLATLDQAILKIAEERIGRVNPARSVSFITGPSRTSDVELVLSIGVHGPKELHVLILD
jgi:L-lactate utilization protein LutC